MADAKQSHLNGAYYGPPIPPKRNSYHRPARSSGCFCGPCCILTTLFKLIVTVVVVLGIAALVLWLIFRPTKVKVYVDEATLTQFQLTNSTTLHYNLSLAMTVRNPNKKIGIYYDKVEARAYYDGERFGYAPLPTFYQGRKNTTNLYPVFTGQASIPLNSDGVSQLFSTEKGRGSFSIDVKIYARIRFKIGSLKTNRYKPHFDCDLSIPLTTNGSSSAAGFTRTKCDIDF
ncbi:yls9-like [Asimina triloba]